MKIVHADEVPYTKPRSNHREGDIEFRRILQGPPDSVHNFEFLFAKTGGRFYGPRHRHNFEQIRYGLRGQMGGRKTDYIEPGQVGYYPENCPYQIDSSDSEIMLIQFGGPSGWGYLSYDRLFKASAELNKLGTFKDGVFFRDRTTNMAPGTRLNQDGYEAIWEHTYGRPLEYPPPRYEGPVLMNPPNYPLVPDPREKGLARRHLGSFSERRIEIAELHLEPGARTTEAAPTAPRFLFATQGAGSAGETPIRRHSLVKLEIGEAVSLAATDKLVLLCVSMPTFSAAEIAFFEERNRKKPAAEAA